MLQDWQDIIQIYKEENVFLGKFVKENNEKFYSVFGLFISSISIFYHVWIASSGQFEVVVLV